MSLWDVFRGNKKDAETVGEFLTCAVDHLRNGGNVAYCTTTLADGTHVKLSIERMTQTDVATKPADHFYEPLDEAAQEKTLGVIVGLKSDASMKSEQSTYGLCSRCGRPLLHGHINTCLGAYR